MKASPSVNGHRRRVPAPSTNGCNGHPTPQPPPAEGRDAQTGRFTRGWKGGPGNPFARAVAQRRKALLDAITPEDLAAVAKALLRLALNGDVAAAKVLLLYTLGKPDDVVNPDRLDVDELALLREAPDVEATTGSMDRITPALACDLISRRHARDDAGWRALAQQRMEALRQSIRDLGGDPDAIE
jgi:hypothetical protein